MKDPIKVSDDFAVGQEQPKKDDLAEIAKRGFRSLVNMREAGEEGETLPPQEEGQAAEAAGLTYRHMPVAGDRLSPELVDRFRQEAESLPKPIFVHCASGKRSGAFTMMHLGIERGLSGQEVIDQALSMGFECDTPDLKDFVRSYVDERSRK